MSTDFHHFWRTHTARNLQQRLGINPPYAMCVTALPCKILIAIFVMFFTAENVTVIFWQYRCQFLSKFQF